jgi:hypothetical protein
MNLHDVIKSSYAKKNKQEEYFGAHGYARDAELSNHNQQVYYNPTEKKLVFTVAGTHNLADIGTDLYLAVGKLKDTNRYKEADRTLKAAKQKYNPETTSVAGHSLGATIGSYAASKSDKVHTLDKGATIGTKTRSNETALRTQGDIVSLLNANSKHMTTLKNPNYQTGVKVYDALQAHNVSNIKDSGIFI